MAGGGCVDVHGVHFEFVRNFTGPLRGSHQANYVSQYYVTFAGKAANCWSLAPELCHMLSTLGWMERGGKRFGKINQKMATVVEAPATLLHCRNWGCCDSLNILMN